MQFRVPKDRIIDAVPVALALILLTFSRMIPPAAPLAMLHVWLWLQHPRRASRYVIAVAFMALYLGLTVGMPLFMIWLSDPQPMPNFKGFIATDVMGTSVVPMHLVSAAGTGIIPILYRIFSRCSLTYAGQSDDPDSKTSSRTGILDLLVLSLLFAVVFISIRVPKEVFDPFQSPVIDFGIAILFSVISIAAMRFNARGTPFPTAIAILAPWLSGSALIAAFFFGIEHIQDEYPNSSAWLYSWNLHLAPFLIGALAISIYPLVCRRCGITLSIPTDPRARENQTNKETLANPSERALSVWRRCCRIAFQLSVSLIVFGSICAFTLSPFTCVDTYGTNDGYRVAGWPVQHLSQSQIEESDSAWYWSDAGIWRTDFFSTGYLLINIAFTLYVFLSLRPPTWLASKLGTRWVSRNRIACTCSIVVVIACVYHLYPSYHEKRLQSINGVSVTEFSYDQKPAFATLLVCLVEDNVLPYGFRHEPKEPSGFRLESADGNAIETVLNHHPIRSIEFKSCTLTDDHLKRLLTKPTITDIALRDCTMPDSTVANLLTLPELDHLRNEKADGFSEVYSPFRVNYRDDYSFFGDGRHAGYQTAGGETRIPPGVTAATLTIPNDIDSQVSLTCSPDLRLLYLRNTLGYVPKSIAGLEIKDAPGLLVVDLDNYQKVDLTIRSAPQLMAIKGYHDEQPNSFARLTNLEITGPHQLLDIRLDTSDCEQLSLPALQQFYGAAEISLTGCSGAQLSNPDLLQSETLAESLSSLSRSLAVESLSFSYATIDRMVGDRLPPNVSSLSLKQCVVASDALDSSRTLLHRCEVFDAPQFAPNDESLVQLLAGASGLTNLRISGKNLTSSNQVYPSSLASLTLLGLPQARDWFPANFPSIQHIALKASQKTDRGERKLGFDFDVSLEGLAATQANLKHLVTRLHTESPFCRVALEAVPDPGLLHGIDWRNAETLEVRDCRLTDEIVASWKLPNVNTLDLSSTDVSLDVIRLVTEKWPTVETLVLNDVDVDSRLPVLDFLPPDVLLYLRGRSLTAEDCRVLGASPARMVDLLRCQLPSEASEMFYGRSRDKRFIVDEAP